MSTINIAGAANLANNIASATRGLATAFGLINPEPHFPTTPEQAITADFQRQNWYVTPSQGLYALMVEPVGSGSSLVSEFPQFVQNIYSTFNSLESRLSGAVDTSFAEFVLPTTPQEINQTEDFAVSLKPTQGGTVVYHSGNKYKTLVISGTTGVAPYRGASGVDKYTGLSIGNPDDLQYRSGYEVFQHFRQWIKAYHETKAASGTTNIRMLWKNYKDWEFLYVEPIKFTMRRDATRPLLYNYNIQFRVTGVKTIDAPLFSLVVNKLNDISTALSNGYTLIKTNKAASEQITGNLNDLTNAVNRLKLSVKASTQGILHFDDIDSTITKKLSNKEALSVLNAIGNAMVQGGNNTRQAEVTNTAPKAANPTKTGLSLIDTAKNPGNISPTAIKNQINGLLDSEPALMKSISLATLPTSVQKDVKTLQQAAASISRVDVMDVKTQVKSTYDKLANGVGLADSTYNSIFGITQTGVSGNQTQLSDDQFEMMYALSQTINSVDGILSSDTMFDTNSQLYSTASANNGSQTIGQGVFSVLNPAGSVKEGPLPANLTLEDIALKELGDSSRWTEIADLNGLKAPYVISLQDALKIAYTVQSEKYNNSADIRDLRIGYFFLIPTAPTPLNAFAGKGNNIAEYLGGDKNTAANWRFIFPDVGTIVFSVGSQNHLQYEHGVWGIVDPSTFTTDGVLKPGDNIKIPAAPSPPIATPLQGPRDNLYTNSLSNSEKSLAVDLKLTSDLDLDLLASGDLAVATGYVNAAQAIVLKLLYSKGSLKKFPTLGSSLQPGKKVPDIASLRSDITASLLQDARIRDVTKINLIQVGGTLTLSFTVIFKDVQQPIPITIPV
jgi:hypothetical protein